MPLTVNQPVAEIVLDHPECAQVLQQHRIDFCCAGEARLAEACAAKGVDPAALLAALEGAVRARRDAAAERDFRAMSVGEVVDHIVARHHAYLRRTLPWLTGLAAKVARVHGEHNPKLVELERAFASLCDTLEPHLDEEEADLFPSLLAGAPRAGLAAQLDAMKAEHRTVGAALEQLRALADDYRAPEWACGSYRTLFAELERLEADTLRHVHLENHVLAPRFRG